MPFELLPEESKKMTIDVEVANKLLDVYSECLVFHSEINAAVWGFGESQLMPNYDLEDLLTIQQDTNDIEIRLKAMINDYINRKGIRKIIENKRSIPS